MKVLVLGGGGREHALCWVLRGSRSLTKLFCVPGNGGISEVAEIPKGLDWRNFEGLASFCQREKIDLVIPGPEEPLVRGVADFLSSRGIKVFGPTKFVAQLEGSKVFAKEIMKRAGVPTANFVVFDDPVKAKDYLIKREAPVVVKADGLCAGKGVFLCDTKEEALRAIEMIMEERIFGEAGDRIIIEEKLQGEEASFIVLTDGENFKALPTSQDHKRLLDNDEGPNTGGMGAYSPAPLITPKLKKAIEERVISPILNQLRKEGNPYLGFLYAGLMIVEGKPYVLEFNCRLGDPEAQAILPRLDGDLLEIIDQTLAGKLFEVDLREKEKWAVCVVMASQGYPGPYESGKKISGLVEVSEIPEVVVFHAGTKRENGNYYTSGGRVLGVTGLAETLPRAIEKTYKACQLIHFEQAYYRRDIGERAFKYL